MGRQLSSLPVAEVLLIKASPRAGVRPLLAAGGSAASVSGVGLFGNAALSGCRPVEYSSEGCCDRTPGRRSQDSPGFGTRVGRVHFPRAERHDRFPGGQKAARMVGARLGACWYSLTCPDPPSGTEEPPSAWAAPPSRDVRLAETGQPCLPTASLDGSVGGPCRHRVGGESVGPPPDPS
ncbi:hypothetical protein ACOMHN_017680 [Nucella lapillus]